MPHKLHPKFLRNAAKEIGRTQADLLRDIATWEKEDKTLYTYIIKDLGGLAEDLHKRQAFHSQQEFEKYMDELEDYFHTVGEAAKIVGNVAFTARLYMFATSGIRRIAQFRQAAVQSWNTETAENRLEAFLEQLRSLVGSTLFHDLDKTELLAHNLEDELKRTA